MTCAIPRGPATARRTLRFRALWDEVDRAGRCWRRPETVGRGALDVTRNDLAIPVAGPRCDPTAGRRLSKYSFTMLAMTVAAEPMRKRSKRIVSVG
jgi:hypothetical protein